jgi:UDP-N-acetylmuramoyl-L-alanyl-D-glutamate--2,6-diaminopimelate ligase
MLSAIKGAVGRFELILPGSKITAIVDYAHTPDALKNVLDTIAQLRTGTNKSFQSWAVEVIVIKPNVR